MIVFRREYDIGGLAAGAAWVSPVIDTLGMPELGALILFRGSFDAGSPGSIATIDVCDAQANPVCNAVCGNSLAAWSQGQYSNNIVAHHTARFYRLSFSAGSNPTPAGARLFLTGLDHA